MIFDFHTHCFPDRIAYRAISKLSYEGGGVPHTTNGTLEDLKYQMKASGVSAYAVLNIATNAGQMTNVNNFAASLICENVFPFGSVHPDAPDALDELCRIKELGLFGVKFHPEGQNFFVDDEKLFPIYKKISQLSLPVVFHSGRDPGFPSPYHCTPKRLKTALKHLDCPVIAAHWGALGMEDEVLDELTDTHVFIDTSQGSRIISRPGAMQILDKFGADRLVFASDTPWGRVDDEINLLSTLELSDSERQSILWDNAMKILNKK